VDVWQMQININNDNMTPSDVVPGTVSDGVILLMPPNPSNRFTGRTEVIAKLKRHFSNTNNSAQKRKYFLLYGMGGIGKTQISLKFAEEMSGR
jgi:Holliday junction resolvasome RuvABC ATP-dependent DNA helicase subunit